MDGTAAGRLTLREPQLTPQIYTPTNLYYTAASEVARDEVELVTKQFSSPVLQQVKAYQTFVNIVALTNATELRFFQPSQIGPQTNSWGHYTNITGNPFVVWAVVNPEPSTTNKLHIVERRNGVSRTNDLAFTAASSTDTWVLKTGSGSTQRVEKRGVVVTGGTNRTETVDIRYNGASKAAYHAVEKYLMFPWGFELVETRTDPDGNPGTSNDLVTSFEYHEDSGEVHSYRKLKWITYPDGHWEKRIYDDYPWQFYGSLLYVLRPDGSEPATPDPAEIENSIVVHYEYDPDTGAPHNIYHLYKEEFPGNFFRQDAHYRSGFNDPSEVTSHSFDGSFVSTMGSFLLGRTAYQFNEWTGVGYSGHHSFVDDFQGWVTCFYHKGGSYDAGSRTFIAGSDPVADGPDFRRSAIRTGTEGANSGAEIFYYSSVEDEPLNWAGGGSIWFKRNQTTRESFTFHKGSMVLRELELFTGDSGGVPVFERLATWRFDNDSLGRATNVVLADATVTNVFRTVYQADYRGTNTFDGDLLLWEIDEHGVKTTHGYDGLKRRVSSTREGVGSFPNLLVTTTFDAQDRPLAQTNSAGGLVLGTARSYDLAGRLLSDTDANGLTHNLTNELGGRRITTTLPSGATRITENYLDRRLRSVTGTGTVAEHHFWDHISTDDQVGRILMNSDVFYEHIVRIGLTNSLRRRNEGFDLAGRTNRFEWPDFGGGTNHYVTFLELTGCDGAKVAQVSDTRGFSGPLLRFDYDWDGATNWVTTTTDDLPYSHQPDSSLRMSRRDAFYSKIGGHWFHCVTNWIYRTEHSDVPTLASVEQQRVSGFTSSSLISEVRSYDADTNLTAVTVSVDRAAKRTTEVMDVPDSTLNATNVFILGLLQSSNSVSSLQPVRFGYDGLGRVTSVTNSVGSISITTYVPSKDQVAATRDFTGMETTYTYYSQGEHGAGQVKTVTVSGKTTRYAYTARGELWRVWGDVPYPEERVYDATYGDFVQLKTYRGGSGWNGESWPGSPGTPDVTTWEYDPASGLLAAKKDNLNRTVSYTWWQGLLKTRSWARGGTVMTNLYNELGEMIGVDYSDSTTPDWSYVNDTSVRFSRTGQPLYLKDVTGDWRLQYDHADRLIAVACTNGLFNGITLSNRFHQVFGRNLLRITGSPSGTLEAGYGYDTYGRYGSVTNASSLVNYSYLSGTDLPQTTTFKHSGTTVLTTTRGWDHGVRLREIESRLGGGGMVSAHRYAYDPWNRRTRALLEDGSSWAYDYNDRSEVLGARRLWSDQNPVAGQQFGFAYDGLGNRTSNAVGGNDQGAGLRTNTWTVNTLNQYSQRTVGSARDVVGVASALAAVSVNGLPADHRRGEYFWKALAVTNSSAPAWTSFTVNATQGSSTNTSGYLLTPPANESFTYDHDGNLTQDGLWTYTWNGENRLIQVESRTTLSPATARRRLELAYDQMGRRVQKKIWEHNGSSYQLKQNLLMVHDGWRLVAELNATNKNVLRSYVWGIDLSGGLEGAGGVGGLVVVNSGGQAHYPAYDGNGNVMGLVQQSQVVSARYEYGPFGEIIRQTGAMAGVNPFRWSTKYWDSETDFVYYGHRYYSTSLGRWINRDPIEEEGGINLYAFVKNRPLIEFDATGLTGTALDTEAGASGSASIQSGGGSQASTFLRQVRQWADEFNDFQQIASEVMDVLENGDDLLIAVLEASNQNAAKARGGESARARVGRAAHDLYNPGNNYNIKSKAWLDGGKLRPDAIDFVRGIVRELKPLTKSGVRQGRIQMKKYLTYLNEQHKREGGWKGFVDYY
jgi:RHS repeat-associated protein